MRLHTVTLVDHRCEIGESPVWDTHHKLLRWCDVTGRRIFSANLDGVIQENIELGEPVGAIDCLNANSLILALRNTVVIYDLARGNCEVIAEVPLGSPTARLNDGKLGPDGAFWIGSIDSALLNSFTSSLYRVQLNGTVEKVLSNIGISNGLAWSLNAERIYHSDTLAGQIKSGSFSFKDGSIKDWTDIAHFEKSEGWPDGGTCNINDEYWSAGVTAGCIHRIDPNGKVIESMPVEVDAPTSIAFLPSQEEPLVGITSLKRESSTNKLDGHTLICKVVT